MPHSFRIRVVIGLSAVLCAGALRAQGPARTSPLPAGDAVPTERKPSSPATRPKDFKPHPLQPIPDDPPPHEGAMIDFPLAVENAGLEAVRDAFAAPLATASRRDSFRSRPPGLLLEPMELGKVEPVGVWGE